MVKPPESRSNNIDALRLILALLVLFSHSYPLGTGSEESEPLAWLSRGQVTLGGLAVDWFFVLSGFLITQSWERSRSAWSFLQKRVCRIYPGFLVAVFICTCLVIPLFSPEGFQVGSWKAIAGRITRSLVLRYSGNTDAFLTNPAPWTVNGSLWTISYEFSCYLGVIALGLTALLGRRRLVTGLFVASLAVSFAMANLDLTSGGKILGRTFDYPTIWARLLPFYLAGVVAYLFRDRFRWDLRLALLALGGLILGALVPRGVPLAFPTLGTYLVLYLAFTTDWKWQTAARYGDFSYGIYLYAFPIQQVIVKVWGGPMNPFLLFGLAFAPTVLAGVASWHLVERRFLRKAHATPVGSSLSVAPRATHEPLSSALG